MDISPHFKRTEFACACGCGFDTVDVETIRVLEVVRQHFMLPITITSGCRCKDHNEKIGGAKNSYHTQGRAADFKIKGLDPITIYDFLNTVYSSELGLGLYSSWIHIDTRSGAAARWQK